MMAKCQENVVNENVLENQGTDVTTFSEPNAPGGHIAHPNTVKPTTHSSIQTISIPIPKSKRKPKKKGSLEGETPEIPVVTQMQLTSVVTSSQQMQTSPPSQTLHFSSQKESVVSTWDTCQRGYISLYYLYSSPSPGAASLSTPPPVSTFQSPLQKLLDVIDASDLHTPSSSQQQITNSSLPQVTRVSSEIIVIPQVEEATPLVSKEI
ncbi:hypothetical protein Hanom_Chr10g00932821 [Helianthus anomalus]